MRRAHVAFVLPLLVAACALSLDGTGDAGADLIPDATVDGAADAGRDQAAEGSGPGMDGGAEDGAPLDAGEDSTQADVDAGPAAFPATCADLGVAAVGQNVTLYLDGDSTKAFPAHCEAGGATFLVLDPNNNSVSEYPSGGCANVSALQSTFAKTTWTMVRFDPPTRMVNTGDFTFATSAGGTTEVSGNGNVVTNYTQMPFGSGRSCQSSSHEVAKIDLAKTKFGVDPTQSFSADGYQAAVLVNADPKWKNVGISAQGSPVGASPCPPNFDYFTTNGGVCLKLVWNP